MLIPVQIQGIIPLGTSLDFESERSRKLGCWDAPTLLSPSIEDLEKQETVSNFEPPESGAHFLIDVGFGKDVASDVRAFWVETIHQNYLGQDGRKRMRMATINLKTRDGLHDRLRDVVCPVLWLHVSTMESGWQCLSCLEVLHADWCLGNQRCRILSGECSGRDQDVRQFS